MDKALDRLKASLSLTEDEDEGVIIPANVWQGDGQKRKYLLVGRILSHKSFHFDSLKSTLLTSFHTVKGLDITNLSGGRLLFTFNHPLDRQRIMDESPWAFDRNLIVLGSLEDTEDPLLVDLNWCSFFVQIHGLPIVMQRKDIAEHIGNRLGQFLEVDFEHRKNRNYDLRIRVRLNINSPLKRALKVKNTLGEELLVTFTYERLPNFCYLCGKLGHISKYCELQYEEGFVDPGDHTPFGPWLRANSGSNQGGRFYANNAQNFTVPATPIFTPFKASFTSALTPHHSGAEAVRNLNMTANSSRLGIQSAQISKFPGEAREVAEEIHQDRGESHILAASSKKPTNQTIPNNSLICIGPSAHQFEAHQENKTKPMSSSQITLQKLGLPSNIHQIQAESFNFPCSQQHNLPSNLTTKQDSLIPTHNAFQCISSNPTIQSESNTPPTTKPNSSFISSLPQSVSIHQQLENIPLQVDISTPHVSSISLYRQTKSVNFEFDGKVGQRKRISVVSKKRKSCNSVDSLADIAQLERKKSNSLQIANDQISSTAGSALQACRQP